MINLNARSIVNKTAELEHILLSRKPDLVVITESWLHPSINDSEIIPPNYNILRNDRASRGGGVAIVIRSGIQYVRLDDIENNESVWCTIQVNNMRVIVGGIYRLPNADITFLEDIKDYLLLHVKNHNKIILAGDFNLAHIDWRTLHAGSSEGESSEELLDIAFTFDLDQLVHEPTRLQGSSQSILDLVLVSHDFSENSTTDVCDGISDHKMVVVSLPLSMTYRNSKRTVPVYDFLNADDVSILDHLELSLDSFRQLSETQNVCINDLWNLFKKIIEDCKKNPWITREIIHIGRKISRLRKNIKRNPSLTNKELLCKLNQTHKEMVSSAKSTYYSYTLPNFMSSSPKKFWRYLQPKRKISNNFLIHGNFTQEASLIAEALNSNFVSVFTSDNRSLPPIESLDHIPRIAELHISEEGILALLLNLDEKKSPGPDLIPTAFLKRYAEWISKYLRIIFQQSLLLGSLPDDWKVSRIVPIFKSGNETDVANYRPISLTSQCCKILEHIICSHITNHLENHSLLTKEQHGFRKGLSTITQLLETAHEFSECINKRSQVDIIFLDFAKAFDKVSHDKLLAKLNVVLKSDSLLKWFEHYLKGRQQFVTLQQ